VENRNRDGANVQDMFTFNEIISNLSLVELPIKGRSYTWSNMQSTPLLEQLDWYFTTTDWTLSFPNTQVHPLSRPVSDHIPCVVKIDSKIPKAAIFRFENYWIRQPGFFEVVANIWAMNAEGNSARVISMKLKWLRKALKKWKGNISNMDMLINNCNSVILMLDELEEVRALHITEWNFRNIIKNKVNHLLTCKDLLWKNRCTIRWAKLGDENTSFFMQWLQCDTGKTILLDFLSLTVLKFLSMMKKLLFCGRHLERDLVLLPTQLCRKKY
jgi:hypothetical protein